MIPDIQPHYVFPESVPTVAVYLLAAAAVGAWMVLHRVWRRPQALVRRALRFAVFTAVGTAALLAVAQAMQRGLVLATNWPIWPIALLGAAAVEIVLGLYALERQTVSRGAGLGLVALRVAVIALVVGMLAQPVRPWDLDKTIQRWVTVLLDTSASMFVPDTQLDPAEKMSLAETLRIPGAARPFALDRVAQDLEQVRQDLAAQGEWLASLGTADEAARKRQLDARAAELNRTFTDADKTLAAQIEAVGKTLVASLKLDARVTEGLEDVRKRLTAPVRENLRLAIALTGKDGAATLDREHERLLQQVREAATQLGDLSVKTAAMGRAVDEAVYASLAPEVRTRVDTVAARKRLALARDVLLKRPPAPEAGGERPPSLRRA